MSLDLVAPRHIDFTDDQLVYLKRGIGVVPLVYGWPAWPHLLAPLQRALNLANRHIPVMKSFISAPGVHLAAMGTPAMEGGAFMEASLSDLPTVRAMLEDTTRERSGLLQLAEGYVDLDRRLQAETDGSSLERFYAELPPSLAGLVELVYDSNHHPRIRFYEELLHRAYPLGGEQQAYVGQIDDEKRSFFLSTPVLTAANGQVLSLRFDDPAHDTLAAARRGVRFGELRQLDGLQLVDGAGAALLTTENPRSAVALPSVSEGRLSLLYFGHACVLVRSENISILLDPLVAWEGAAQRYSYEDLPAQIDYLAITHGHQDHLSAETLLQLRGRSGRVLVPANNPGAAVDPSLKLMVRALGYKDVRALGEFEEEHFINGRIVSIPFPGEHAELDIYSKQAIFIEICGKKLLFVADSNAFDQSLYKRLAEMFGSVDLLFLGMECQGAPLSWLYGPLITAPLTRKIDESRRLSASHADRALTVVDALRPKQVYLYAMGQEPHVRYLTGLAYDDDSTQLVEARRFVEICQHRGLPVRHLFGSESIEI